MYKYIALFSCTLIHIYAAIDGNCSHSTLILLEKTLTGSEVIRAFHKTTYPQFTRKLSMNIGYTSGACILSLMRSEMLLFICFTRSIIVDQVTCMRNFINWNVMDLVNRGAKSRRS